MRRGGMGQFNPTTETRVKTETKMFGAVAVLLALASTPAFAASGRTASKPSVKHYCLNPSSGGSSCGFTSMEQCWETMRGRNGWCSEQVDFGAWQAAHGGWNNEGSEGSYASYPRGRMSPHDADMAKLHKDDMPSKGVGSE
jgi:hypothetical protein